MHRTTWQYLQSSHKRKVMLGVEHFMSRYHLFKHTTKPNYHDSEKKYHKNSFKQLLFFIAPVIIY